MDNSNILPSKKAGKNPTDITSIRCTWRLKDFLAKHGLRGESDEAVIWRLLGMKLLSKEIKQDLKKSFEKELDWNGKRNEIDFRNFIYFN